MGVAVTSGKKTGKQASSGTLERKKPQVNQFPLKLSDLSLILQRELAYLAIRTKRFKLKYKCVHISESKISGLTL